MQTRYRVRHGQVLAHCGALVRGGEVVDLSPEVAYEVRHLVDPVGADGKVTAWPTDAATQLAKDLAAARPHERISILQAAREHRQIDLATIDADIAAEERRLAAVEVSTAPSPTSASKGGK